MKRLLSSLSLALVTAAPAVAEACPQCAGREDGGIFVGVLIGSMIVLPFPVTWLVVRLIKRSEAAEREDPEI